MKYVMVLWCALLFFASTASAAVTVNEQVLQKGLFFDSACKGENQCMCEADIKYPVINGMADAHAQEVLNKSFKDAATQVQCKGEASKEAPKDTDSSIKYSYEVTFQSPQIMGLEFTNWAYEGGAHGNGIIEGMIFDLEKNKYLTADDIFGANMAAVNQAIYDALAPNSEGIFHDEIESRKGAFIKDGKCNGCTLVLKPEGINVIFQLYEIASFADGNKSVSIPDKLIAYPAILKALSQTKS